MGNDVSLIKKNIKIQWSISDILTLKKQLSDISTPGSQVNKGQKLLTNDVANIERLFSTYKRNIYSKWKKTVASLKTLNGGGFI